MNRKVDNQIMHKSVQPIILHFTARSALRSPLSVARGATCLILLWLSGLDIISSAGAGAAWRIVARADNDVLRVLQDAGAKVERFDDAATAEAQSPAGAGVLVLADQYPQQTTRLSSELFNEARDKKLRLYVEYPSFVPAFKLGAPQTLKTGHWGNILERTVVVSDAFGDALKKMRILMIHDCHYLPVEASQPHLVIARVAGYDDALYREAADKIVRFLCRVQVKSTAQPQLDGGWFRGFDYRRWEYWGRDADVGWSLYTMETGWISGEILSVLALRQMKTSLWELTATSTIPRHVEAWRGRMLPDEVLKKTASTDTDK